MIERREKAAERVPILVPDLTFDEGLWANLDEYKRDEVAFGTKLRDISKKKLCDT